MSDVYTVVVKKNDEVIHEGTYGHISVSSSRNVLPRQQVGEITPSELYVEPGSEVSTIIASTKEIEN